jgi:ABC-type glycerol-3-phosphate transport system permease component
VGVSVVSAVRRRARGNAGRLVQTAVLYGALVALGVIFVVPLLWMVRTSLLPPSLIAVEPPVWVSVPPRFENYVLMWQAGLFPAWVRNSVVVTTLGLIGDTVSSTLIAFGFARTRFPGRDKLFLVVLATMMVPFHVVLVPQFFLFNALGWINTLWPLIVPTFFGSAFYIFILRQFFLTLPKELDEAAEIDGAGLLDVLWRIVVPLSKPAIATVGVFSFINHWNDFLRPLIFLQLPERLTLAVGLRWFTGRESTEFHLLMAASFMALLPVIVVFFVAQKQFVRGIALTGLKG